MFSHFAGGKFLFISRWIFDGLFFRWHLGRTTACTIRTQQDRRIVGYVGHDLLT